MEKIDIPDSGAPGERDAAAWRERTDRLYAEIRELRARMVRAEADYAAGRLTADERMAMALQFESELVAAIREVHTLARSRP